MTNGILLALIAYASYSGSDAVVKSLGGQFTVFEIGFFSTLFAGCFLFFARPAHERWRDFWRTSRPWAVQARAWAGIASGVLSVYAFTTIPLAEVYALVFLAPLCVTILSTVILKEKVGPWRWLAVVAGFAGVMLVVRPGFRELNLGHLAAFGVDAHHSKPDSLTPIDAGRAGHTIYEHVDGGCEVVGVEVTA